MSGNENIRVQHCAVKAKWQWIILNGYAVLSGRVHFRKFNITNVVLCKQGQAPSFLFHAADRENTVVDKKTCRQGKALHSDVRSHEDNTLTYSLFHKLSIHEKYNFIHVFLEQKAHLKAQMGRWVLAFWYCHSSRMSILVYNTYIAPDIKEVNAKNTSNIKCSITTTTFLLFLTLPCRVFLLF